MPALVIPSAKRLYGPRPTSPYCINGASPQARGLVCWAPLGQGGRLDVVSNVPFTATTNIAGLGADASLGTGYNAPGFDTTTVLAGPTSASYVSTQFTVSAWVKPYSFQAASPFISGLVTFKDPNTAIAQLIRFGDGGLNKAKLQGVFNATKVDGITINSAYEPIHAALTYDGATLRLYRNGVQENTTAGALTDTAASRRLHLACDDTLGRPPDAMLADVRRYSRALAADEVWALYAPATRWDLYWTPSMRVFFAAAAASTTTTGQVAPQLGRYDGVVANPNAPSLGITSGGYFGA